MQSDAGLDALDVKLNQVLNGKVVRKDLVHRIKKGTNVPTFVLEFLLARYCASAQRVRAFTCSEPSPNCAVRSARRVANSLRMELTSSATSTASSGSSLNTWASSSRM